MLYRKLLPAEASAYCAHLLRLDEEDRYARFCAVTGDAVIRAHCRGIDWRRTVITGGFERGVLRAAAELRGGGGLPPSAEVALSVERSWQGLGVGRELLRRALLAARNRGLRRVAVLCLGDNIRMRRLAGGTMDRLEMGEGRVFGTADLPWPTGMTVMREFMEDGVEVVRALI